MARKEYTREFREQTCRLVKEEGYSVARAAKGLGMCENTLCQWLRHRGRPQGPSDPGPLTGGQGPLACSPKMVPSAMRVFNRLMGPERTLHERQEAHTRTDHRQAA
jgi:transposase